MGIHSRVNDTEYCRIRGFHRWNPLLSYKELQERWDLFICCNCGLLKSPKMNRYGRKEAPLKEGKRICYQCWHKEYNKEYKLKKRIKIV